jgi:heat shock protein HspQ
LKIFDLEFDIDHYYIKRSAIVEKIPFNNRTFYAKFERINELPSELVVKQHSNRQYTIAVPLVKDNHTNYLVIEYKGDEYQRFYHLVIHLFKTLKINDYHIYQGKDLERLQVFISVKNLSLEEADERVRHFSDALKEKMTKKWKTLPSLNLPEAYNIVTLPYSRLS